MKPVIKQLLLFAALTLMLNVAHSQTKTTADTVKTKTEVKPAPIPYLPDPNRVYQINLTENEVVGIANVLPFGVQPYLENSNAMAKDIPNVKKMYGALIDKIVQQYRQQWQADRNKFVADSIKAIPSAKAKSK